MLDQNFLFMAFLMLCFAGLATMFYFLMRNIDELTRMLREDRNQMQTNLRALESSLNHLGDLLGRLTAEPDMPRGGVPARPDQLRPGQPHSDPLRPEHPRPDPLRPAPVPGLGAPIQMADSGLASRREPRPATTPPLQTAAPAPDETPAAPRAAAPGYASAPLSFSGSGELNLNLSPKTENPSAPLASSAPASAPAESGASALPSLSLDGDRQIRRR